MKKLALAFCFLVLTFFSCSTEDPSNSGQSTAILPKKIINIDQRVTYTSIYSYTGNKITTVDDSNGEYLVFEYTGNLITKIIDYEPDNSVHQTLAYTYVNGKLATYTDDEAYPVIYKSDLTHNTDGTVSVLHTTVNAETKEITDNYSEIMTFKNGNLIKSIYTLSYSADIYTTNYEYDNKNHPFKNVVGCSALLGFVYDDFGNGSVNNLTKSITTYSFSSGSETDLTTYTYEDNGFPKESVATAQYVGSNKYFY